MKKTFLAFLILALLFVAGIAIVIFKDDAPPDVSHLNARILPPSQGDAPLSPLAEDSPFMSMPIILPEGIRDIQISSELMSAIKRKSSHNALARKVLTDNTAILNAIEAALEIEIWESESQWPPFTRITDAALLKLLQGVVEEADAAPDLGIMRDLEAAAIFAHLDERPGGIIEQTLSAPGRGIALRISSFPSRVARVTDAEILAVAVKKLRTIRMSPHRMSETLKRDFQKHRLVLNKPRSDLIQAWKAMGHGWKANLFKVNRTTSELASYYTKALNPILPSRDRKNLTVPEITGLPSNYSGHAYVEIVIAAVKKQMDDWIHYHVQHEALIAFVAVRHFEVVEGARPATLQDLVPRYLDSVPVDAYDGELLRYNAEKGWVYSVGKDFVDNGGDPEPGQFLSPSDPTFFF
ncbi:MAG: hypothetical protein ACI9R3_005426 [Verrucomicrobiales bacterium]|jgi:hypothetical protein